MVMNTMTMPGFTAEASLYSKGGFGKAAVAVSQNTTERVQPALRFTSCFAIGEAYADAVWAGNFNLAHFLLGFAGSLGCDVAGMGGYGSGR
jgi:hypothetical protein